MFVSRIGRIHDANATSEDAQSQSLLTLLSARCNTEDPESCWYQLRHMLGRLRSYPSGIGPLLRAHARFPRLFDSPRVKVLPAHPVDPRPIRNGQPQTAESILSYMLPPTSASDEASSEFKRYAGYLRDIDALAAVAGGRDLNTSIAERWVTLKPLVHAEIALVDWLRHTNPDDNDDDVDSATPTEDDTVNDEDDEGDGIGAITRRARRITNTSRLPPTSAGNDGLRATRFFGGWAYVGSSKGPCRLCEYYLATLPESARVTMRHGHGNLYAPWRLPDPPLENDNDFRSVSLAERRTIPAGGTTERDLRALVREQMAASQRARDAALRAHDLTLDEILHRLRRDVLRDLEERCAPRRRFDSSTLTRTVATRVLSGGDDGSVIGLTPATNGDSEPSVAADDDGTPGVSNRRDHVVRGGGSGSVDGSNDSYDDSLWKSMSYLTLRRAQHAASPEGAAFAETASVLGEDGEWDRH